jgi:hypothetical protein
VIAASAAVLLNLRRSDYSMVERLRGEQDEEGTRSEHVRQRFFRLYQEHPQSAMYIYLWARCVDDPAKQLELARQGIAADPKFSWNYNMASRALARMGKVPEAYDQAVQGAALDPGNLELTTKLRALKIILDRKLLDQPKLDDLPAGTAKAGARYQGLYRSDLRAPEGPDADAIARSGRVGDAKISDTVRGFVLCANPYADVCVHVYVPRDGRLRPAWPEPASDVGALREHQVVTVSGVALTNPRGGAVLLADTLAAEPQ